MFEWHFEFKDIKGTHQAAIDLVIREFMHDIAEFAFESFARHIPFDSGRTLNALSEGRVNKTPWGYTVDVGVEPVSTVRDGESPLYPLFVHEGTGIFRSDGKGKMIYPEHGNVMAFEKSTGETVFTRWVRGQAPQPYSEIVDEETNEYIRGREKILAATLSTLL